MNRRGALTVLAFLAAGVLVGAFATTYIHSSPTAIAATSSGQTVYGNGGPMQTLGYMDGQIEVG